MVKGYMAFSLSMEVCDAIRKIKESGRYKSSSAYVEKCIRQSFEPEFPDIEDSEKALKRAEELEFAARNYRDSANRVKPIVEVTAQSEVQQLSQEEQNLLASTAAPETPGVD